MKSALRVAALASMLALALAPGAHAANEDYDNLNGVTLGDTPYTSVMPFVPPMQNFDNSTFDAEPEYAASAPAFTALCAAGAGAARGCASPQRSRVRIFVSVDSSAGRIRRDVFYNIYTVPTSIPPGQREHDAA